MILTEMLADVRRELNEPSSLGHITDHEIAAFINRGQDFLVAKITEADQNFFEESDQSLGFISGQEEYDLPAAVWDRKITRVTRTDLSQPKQLKRIRFQEKEQWHSANVFLSGSDVHGEVYYVRGNRIGFKPTAASTIAHNILIHYVCLPHEMHWADVAAPTATTFTMPTATSGPAPILRGGRISTTPNYYVGARIRILTGACRGLERTITAFNVATCEATIDEAWTPADVTHVQYVVLTQVPIEYHHALYQYAIMACAEKKGDRDRLQIAQATFARVYDELVNNIEPRTFDENQHVRPPVDQQFD